MGAALSGHHRKVYKSGDWYEGDYIDGQRSGVGIYVSQAGHRYEGEWKADVRHGKGTITFAKQVDDQQKAEADDGRHSRSNGDAESNGAGNNQPWKNGTAAHNNGVAGDNDAKQAEQQHGTSHEHQQQSESDMSLHRAASRRNDANRNGTQTTPAISTLRPDNNDATVAGNQADSQRSTHAVWGGSYEGEWHHDKKNGNGVFHYENGDSYEGEWQHNHKHGMGVYQFSNGDRYEGEFVDGNMQGKGVYIYSNGDQLVGSYHDDEQTGPALLLTADGNERNEMWEAGVRRSASHFEPQTRNRGQQMQQQYDEQIARLDAEGANEQADALNNGRDADTPPAGEDICVDVARMSANSLQQSIADTGSHTVSDTNVNNNYRTVNSSIYASINDMTSQSAYTQHNRPQSSSASSTPSFRHRSSHQQASKEPAMQHVTTDSRQSNPSDNHN